MSPLCLNKEIISDYFKYYHELSYEKKKKMSTITIQYMLNVIEF
jgi:hypothetical protein